MGGRDAETFTVCNICDTHGEFKTRSAAQEGMRTHFIETGHDDQRYSTPTSAGWKRYLPPEAA